MVQTRLANLQNQVTLFKVLGGGARLQAEPISQKSGATP
jgi:hypothetical protein